MSQFWQLLPHEYFNVCWYKCWWIVMVMRNFWNSLTLLFIQLLKAVKVFFLHLCGWLLFPAFYKTDNGLVRRDMSLLLQYVCGIWDYAMFLLFLSFLFQCHMSWRRASFSKLLFIKMTVSYLFFTFIFHEIHTNINKGQWKYTIIVNLIRLSCNKVYMTSLTVRVLSIYLVTLWLGGIIKCMWT